MLVFAVDVKHKKPAGFGNVQVNHTTTTSFALAATLICYAQLTQPITTGNHNPTIWLLHQQTLQVRVVFVIQVLANGGGKFTRFDEFSPREPPNSIPLCGMRQ